MRLTTRRLYVVLRCLVYFSAHGYPITDTEVNQVTYVGNSGLHQSPVRRANASLDLSSANKKRAIWADNLRFALTKKRHFQHVSAKAHTHCYHPSVRAVSTMELSRASLVVAIVAGFSGVLLFTPYEPFFEGVIALAIIVAAAVGFLMHPRREVFYVRTSVRLIDPDRRQVLEHEFLAVRIELVRLWLLFVPTLLSVAVLVFFAASGPAKFSYLNWAFSSRFAYILILFCQYPPLLVFVLLVAWIDERRVMRDAEA